MKLKYTWITFIVAILSVIPLGLYISISQEQSSITTTSNKVPSFIFVALTVILIIAIIIFAMFTKNLPERIELPKDIFCGIMAAVSGFAMIVTGIYEFMSLSIEFDVKMILLSISIILSGIIFLGTSIIHITGKNLFIPLPILALLPTLWAGIRLSILFWYHSSVVSGDINMIDMMSAMFLLLFFFAHARIIAYVKGTKITQRLFAFGLPAALLLILYTVSEFFKMSYIFEFSFMYVVNLALAAYIISLLIKITFSKKYTKKEYSMYGNKGKE